MYAGCAVLSACAISATHLAFQFAALPPLAAAALDVLQPR
jgi:hypothetical protein